MAQNGGRNIAHGWGYGSWRCLATGLLAVLKVDGCSLASRLEMKTFRSGSEASAVSSRAIDSPRQLARSSLIIGQL